MFSGFWRTYRRCNHCNYRFEREQGFFVGAMYVSYAIAVALAAPVALLLFLFPLSLAWHVAVVVAVLIGAAPLNYRISRTLWLHINYLFGD